MKDSKSTDADVREVQFLKVASGDDLPYWAKGNKVVEFFHTTMKPYEDRPEDIERALDYAFSNHQGKGGFLMLARVDGRLSGALLMLNTAMKGYVPENILVFVTIAPELRGCGIGRQLIEHSVNECEGDVKLHVEYNNPAKRLYERMGFTSKYAEMRYKK